jgi:plasmid stabilization system protein ParE
MHKVRITRTASDDLDSIQAYGLAQFGAKSALAFMNGFDRIFARLGSYPLAGVAAPRYGRAVRSCLHSPYRVFYRYEAGVVSVLRVIHAAQGARPIDDTRE